MITGHVGPKAFRTLHAAGIKIFLATASTVIGVLEDFKAGKLKETTTANVEGHWA